jgi:hypothetical protein
MRKLALGGRVFFIAAVAAACAREVNPDDGAMAGAGGVGAVDGASGGRGGSALGSGGADEPGTGGSTEGGSSVGGGRGVVGGAAGMGAYGGKPPIGSAGATGAESGGGNGAEPGTGGTDAMGGNTGTGAGGTPPITGGNTGAGGRTGAAGVSGATNETGGVGTTGGSASQTGGGGGSGGMTPIGGCNNELLVNAGFDSGKGVGWEEMSDWPGIDLVVNEDDPALIAEGVSPYAGSFLAWLGGIPDNEWDHNVTLIQQRVLIPATASSLTLSGRHLVQSTDDPSAEYDEAYLEFDLDDAVVWQSIRLTNLSASTGWVSFSKTTTDLEDLAGKTLLFYAYARTDLTGKTSFFLDSLSLVASCGR